LASIALYFALEQRTQRGGRGTGTRPELVPWIRIIRASLTLPVDKQSAAMTFDPLLPVLAPNLAPYPHRKANRPSQTEVGSGMTDIDPKSDIELHTVNEHVIVRVPLAGPVTGEWLRCYQRLGPGDRGARAGSGTS
jgi:hypothetical protein